MPSTPATRMLGRAIHEARAAQDYSREYVAELTGHDLSTIQRAENGSTDIKVSTLVVIAEALGTQPKDLLEGITADMVPSRVPRSENRRRIEAARNTRKAAG